MNKKEVITKIDNVYKRHHTASRRGYCKVDMIGTYETYNGRFGEGYIRRNGCHNGSTRYESITYFIKEGSKPRMPKDCVEVRIPSAAKNESLGFGLDCDVLEQIGLNTKSEEVVYIAGNHACVRTKLMASQNHYGGRKLAFLREHAIKIKWGYLLSASNWKRFSDKFINN